MFKKILPAFLLLIILCAFNIADDLKGTWVYSGGIYNGKAQSPSKNYVLQRKYDTDHYEARFIETGEKPIIYERGDYKLNRDTCLETQTFSEQPSKLLNITIKYRYKVSNDTLTFNGTLPNGTVVEEYWQRVK